MKQMPMFLMLLLATALSDGAAPGGVARTDKTKDRGMAANSADEGLSSLDEAEHASLRSRKNAA